MASMDSGKIIVQLPEREEMLERLLRLQDFPLANADFFPLLLRNAGQKLAPRGVLIMIMLAIEEYNKGFRIGLYDMMFATFKIVNVLVDDENAREAIKEMFPE